MRNTVQGEAPSDGRIQVSQHAEHVHVGDGEEGQGEHQGQAGESVNVPLLAQQLSGDDPIAAEERDGGRGDGKGWRDDGDKADEMKKALTGYVHTSLHVGEEEADECSDGSDDEA